MTPDFPPPVLAVIRRYRMPARLEKRHAEEGLTVREAKDLAQDIRIWLISIGLDDEEERHDGRER